MNINSNKIRQFKDIIKNSRSILIVSHISPDHDAICSSLLLLRTLKKNFVNSKVSLAFEDDLSRIRYINTKEVIHSSIIDVLCAYSIDCLIILDTNSLDKITRINVNNLRSYISKNDIKTVVIDHHETSDKYNFSLVLCDTEISSTTQIVYQICYWRLALKKPKNIGQVTMLGIVHDSGIFTYEYDYSDTFLIVNELMEQGATVREASMQMRELSLSQMYVIAELAKNISVESDYSYSYISDEFIIKNRDLFDPFSYKYACSTFANSYIGNINGNKWGFIIYPNLTYGSKEYRVSFRSSKKSAIDLNTIAKYLGSSGDGHANSRGLNLQQPDVCVALKKVKHAIARFR